MLGSVPYLAGVPQETDKALVCQLILMVQEQTFLTWDISNSMHLAATYVTAYPHTFILIIHQI
jgi:hypothetical protein